MLSNVAMRWRQRASKRARIFVVIWACLYSSLILVIYVSSVGQRYPVFLPSAPPAWMAVLQIFGVLALTATLPKSLSQPGDLVRTLMTLFLALPATVLVPTFANFSISTRVAAFSTILTAQILINVSGLVRFSMGSSMGLSPNRFLVLLVFAVLVLGLFANLDLGIYLELNGPMDVYELRRNYALREASTAFPLTPYIANWVSKLLAPALFAGGLVWRQGWAVLCGTLVMAFVYLSTGERSLIFTILGISALWLVGRRESTRLAGPWLVGGLTIIFGVAWAAYRLLNRYELVHLTSRRVAMDPAMTTTAYFDYFESHPYDRWSHSILQWLIPSPNSDSPDNLVGSSYFSEGQHSNVNAIADGFANLGFVGAGVATVLLVIFLWTFDSLSRNKNQLFAALSLVGPSLGLANGALESQLLSNGLILGLVVVALSPVNDQQLCQRNTQLALRRESQDNSANARSKSPKNLGGG